MQRPVSIAFRDMAPSPAVEARIRSQVEKLEHMFNRIIGCHVVVEGPNHRQHKGELYRISINLKVPGREIAVTGAGPQDHAHEDIYVAIRDAFDAVVRRLEDHARRERGVEKAHEAPTHGEVQRLFPAEDYGFVLTSDGDEVYFHKNSVVNGAFDTLKVGSKVRLVVAENEGEHGPQASTVIPIKKHQSVS
jgi:ribosome-associated translation inhibitor RaiA/cold shock CspA family protein